MARATINRLSDRKAKTAKLGMHADGGGLYLRVTVGTNGVVSRYWLFRYADRRTGKDRQLGLGPLGTVSLAQARSVARECREQLLAGLDPVEQRRAQRASNALAAAKAMTFDACRDAYIAAHRAGWQNVKHAKQWTTSLATYVTPVFSHMPVAAVDTGLVLKALEPIWATKSETASRLRGRIEAILDWAKVRGYREGENPARWRGHLDKLLPAPAKVRRVKHHAALPYSELPDFMTALQKEEGIAARALEFVILTVARTGEVIGARWGEIDKADKVWTVPAGRMKAAKAHRVPLSARAIAILDEVKLLCDARDGHDEAEAFVFPGGKSGQPLSTMAFLRLLRRMKRGDLSTHGF